MKGNGIPQKKRHVLTYMQSPDSSYSLLVQIYHILLRANKLYDWRNNRFNAITL